MNYTRSLDLFPPTQVDAPPPLPDRIPCVALWEPYASLVIAGVKTIETRTWPWPYPPGWLAIHHAKHIDRHAELVLGDVLTEHGITYGASGSVTGLVYVTGSRPLVPADECAACFYAPNRFAWDLKWPRKFKTPIVMRGPQKFVFLNLRRPAESNWPMSVEEALGE